MRILPDWQPWQAGDYPPMAGHVGLGLGIDLERGSSLVGPVWGWNVSLGEGSYIRVYLGFYLTKEVPDEALHKRKL